MKSVRIRMPMNATWDNLMREIYVREAIEKGLADSVSGRTCDVKEVRAKYGLAVIPDPAEGAWQA